MWTAYAVEPPDEGVVAGLEEQHAHSQPRTIKVSECGGDIRGEPAAAHVDDDSDLVDRALGAGGELDHRADERRRQVVDDEPTQVLQALRRRAAAGSGQA